MTATSLVGIMMMRRRGTADAWRVATASCNRFHSVDAQSQQRSFMSTQIQEAPMVEEASMMLILGKPGGGKGTISGKILKVGS